MTSRSNDSESIERYLNGDMSREEIFAFENRMAIEKELAEEVAFEKDILKGMNQYFNKNLKEKLQKEEKNIRKKQDKKVRPISHFHWQIPAVAASLLLLLSVGWFYFFGQTNNLELFQSYYRPYPNIEAPLIRAEAGETSEPNPFKMYEQGDYESAVNAFEQSLADSVGNHHSPTAIKFYLALSLIHTGDTENAVTLLSDLDTTADPKYATPAQWYLALAYLKIDRREDAGIILNELAKGQNAYSKKVEDLLNELDN